MLPIVKMAHFHHSNRGNYEIAEMLVKAGADVNLTDWRSWTPVGVAAYLGFWRVLKVLVADPAANLNCQVYREVLVMVYGNSDDP